MPPANASQPPSTNGTAVSAGLTPAEIIGDMEQNKDWGEQMDPRLQPISHPGGPWYRDPDIVKDRSPSCLTSIPPPPPLYLFLAKGHLALMLFFPLSSRGFFSAKSHCSLVL